MRRYSLSYLPLDFLHRFAYSCLVFFQIVPFQLLLMEQPLPPFLLIVVFLRFLFYIQLYSYFSSTIFLAALLTLFTLMLMTQLSILPLISIVLHRLYLGLPLVYSFLIQFLPIWSGFLSGVTVIL